MASVDRASTIFKYLINFPVSGLTPFKIGIKGFSRSIGSKMAGHLSEKTGMFCSDLCNKMNVFYAFFRTLKHVNLLF